MLKLLACPRCKGEVAPAEDGRGGLLCESCRLRYPVEDGIPVMLAEEAETI
ncbi:MAG: Trm112 family protein [Pseudomonadota bacterium]